MHKQLSAKIYFIIDVKSPSDVTLFENSLWNKLMHENWLKVLDIQCFVEQKILLSLSLVCK